jgi:F-type H+-transporting ATPase subunit a
MVFHEVQDQAKEWTIFERLGGGYSISLEGLCFELGGYEVCITKFMILEVIAALIILAIFVPLARRIRGGDLPRGWYWNFFESLLVFVRDQIARPSLDDPHAHAHAGHGHEGHHVEEHTGDKFVPFLWTLFMFILLINLLGMIPFMGSPTASIWVTGGLALCSFVLMHGAGLAARGGLMAYFASIWPPIDVPYVGWLLSAFVFALELFGTAIKSGVLAVRLFANMFAGHMVLGMILLFIYTVGKIEPPAYGLWVGVSLASVFGVVALSLLELFVAFLQAYVFTFLTALFIGMNLHPEH